MAGGGVVCGSSQRFRSILCFVLSCRGSELSGLLAERVGLARLQDRRHQT